MSALLKPRAEPRRDFKYVGKRPVRHDGPDKVTGRANYGADFTLPGMIHGVVVRSPFAHARILSIDTREAEGATLHSAAQQVLANLGRPNDPVITVEDLADTTKLFANTAIPAVRTEAGRDEIARAAQAIEGRRLPSHCSAKPKQLGKGTSDQR